MQKLRPYLFTLILSIFFVQQSWAQQAASAKLLTEFNFIELHGGVILIKALMEGVPDTLQFILDTGSGGISIDSTICAYYGLETVPTDRVVRGIGGVRYVSFLRNHSLLLPNLKVDSLHFHVYDYQIISQVYGVQIDGIIGYGLLNRFIVELNYDVDRIRILEPGDYVYPHKGQLLKPQLTFIPLLLSPLKNGKYQSHMRYFFDTGAGMCLILTKQHALDSGLLLRRKQKLIPIEAQGLGGKMHMEITTISEIQVGDHVFKNVPTYLFEDVNQLTSYPSTGGIIGNDLLRRFNVVLNYPRKEIHIVPNKAYRQPFDYSYTGLVYYYVDNQIVIMDVMKNSPAEKAGFQIGDILLAINNDFQLTIQSVRTALEHPKTRVTILIRRDQHLQIKKLHIRSIL
jgi:hypothetical protein